VKVKLCAAAVVVIFAAPILVSAQSIPAFSGADGAAANVSGGRGGIVYHVTKLNSAIDDPERNDPGTIRYGLNSANFPANTPRTIVFDVGGVFYLGRLPQPANNWDPNENGWDAQSRLTIGGSNVTIAGQTAPGAGVIFMGGGLKPQGNNNIIRNVTVASGYGLTGWWKPGNPFPGVPGSAEAGTDRAAWFPDNVVYDDMDIAGTNLMIDHVSTVFGTDETISMNEVANNITVQYSNISQGLNYPQADAENNGSLTGHALGSLLSAGNTTAQAAISFHHNLYAHLKGRVPQLGSIDGSLGAYYDFRNNVFYNWLGTAGSKSGTTWLNLVNNFYLAGHGGDNPIGGSNPGITTANGGTGVLGASSSVYRNGNLLDSNRDGDANDGAALSAGGAASPLWMGGVPTYGGVTDTAAQAFDRVLNYLGANWWTRDSVIDTPDERIIHEARTGTGKIIAWADDPWNNDPAEGVEWRALKNTPQTNRPANWDADGDGMPDMWEQSHSLNPSVADNNGDFDSDGYTNLEEYLNEIAAWPAPQPIVFSGATNNRYAQITNWDIRWQPSKYDQAQINSGAAVVDAVGQHAGTIVVAAESGNTAQLNITGGWLLVNDAVVIGGTPTSNGTLNLSGGTLTAPLLTKGSGGEFNFTGGTLHAGIVDFDLVNNGGTISPGQSPGNMAIHGQLQINSGVLEIDLATTALFDTVAASGDVTLGGDLHVLLAAGFLPSKQDVFEIVAGQSITGAFANLTAGSRIAIEGTSASLLVSVAGSEVMLSNFLTGLSGDYNNDGIVDTADYVVWRKSLTSNTPLDNETASAGVTDDADLVAWRANFGATLGAGGLGVFVVPEPSAFVLVCGMVLAYWARRGQMSGCR
jgi:hypothetical protein